MTTVSIFADILKSYEYSSEAQRQKAQREQQKEEMLTEERNAAYLKNYSRLIPYSGRSVFNSAAVTQRRLTSLALTAEYYVNDNVFLAVKADIETMQNQGLKFIEGQNAVGQKYWTSDVGLVYQIHSKQKYGFEEFEGVRYPDIEWLIQSLESMEFLSFVPIHFVGELKDHKNRDIIKARRDALAENSRIKHYQHVDGMLVKLNVEVTDVNRQLYDFILSYDYTVDFSDDGLKSSRHNAMERHFRVLAKQHAPALIEHLDMLIREDAKVRNFS